jgi:rfaE bifunctional protein kinase chain/domain
MLDEYIWGEVRRISPEAPVPVVEVHRRIYVPGGAANAAANVVSLGGGALLGGVVGPDHAAAKLAETLIQYGMDCEGLIVDHERPTTTKTRIVAKNQQVVRVDSEQRTALPIHLEDVLLRWAGKHLQEVDACILSDYAKGVVSTQLADCFVHMTRQVGKPLVVDPKGTNHVKYRGATVVTPNTYEAERALNPEINSESDLIEAGWQLSGLLGASALLITRGPQGMSLFLKGAQPLHMATTAHSVFDVTGAGDTVISTLAMALAAGATLEQAAHLSNRAAGIVVGKFGTTTLTLDELMRDGG